MTAHEKSDALDIFFRPLAILYLEPAGRLDDRHLRSRKAGHADRHQRVAFFASPSRSRTTSWQRCQRAQEERKWKEKRRGERERRARQNSPARLAWAYYRRRLSTRSSRAALPQAPAFQPYSLTTSQPWRRVDWIKS